MPEKHRLSKVSASLLRAGAKNKIRNREKLSVGLKLTVAAFLVLSVLLIHCAAASADAFFPELYSHTIIEETVASEALTSPSNVFFVDFTKYAAKPLVRNMTVELSEPVAYFSCALNVLNEKPFLYADIPNAWNASRYYTIRFLSETTSKIANVTMLFALEKSEIHNDEEVTFTLYRYDKGRIYECLLEKIAEDENFLYFKTTTKGYSFIAFTRATVAAELWWLAAAAIAIVTLMTLTGIIVYKQFHKNSRKMVKK